MELWFELGGRDNLTSKSKALGSVPSTGKQYKTNLLTNPRHTFKKVVCGLSTSTCATIEHTAFMARTSHLTVHCH